MDMDKLEAYATEHGEIIYKERMTDIFTDVQQIYLRAMQGKIPWKQACAEMDKERDFYFGKAKLMEKFANIVDDIDAVIREENIDKKLTVEEYEELINKICNFDYSYYNDHIAEIIRAL